MLLRALLSEAMSKRPYSKKELPTDEEIEEIIRDPGYSAGERKSKLKQLLTEIQRADGSDEDRQKNRLLRLVKESIRDLQDGKPISDDTL